MIKFVVMFREPKKLADFENAYNDFLALVERLPHIQRRQVVHVTGSPRGRTPYHRLLELYFNSDDEMREALMSAAGQEAGNELGRFQVGTYDVLYADVYEESGGSTPSPATPDKQEQQESDQD